MKTYKSVENVIFGVLIRHVFDYSASFYCDTEYFNRKKICKCHELVKSWYLALFRIRFCRWVALFSMTSIVTDTRLFEDYILDSFFAWFSPICCLLLGTFSFLFCFVILILTWLRLETNKMLWFTKNGTKLDFSLCSPVFMVQV